MPNIVTHSEHLEHHLQPYKDIIGKDFEGYRGHLYRVLNYMLYLLEGDQTDQDIIEFALVHHDVGLWTDHELAYLEPSIEQAKKVIHDQHLKFDETLVSDLIFYHHKITAYSGPHAKLVNIFRKADWVDASKGKIRKGISKEFITQVQTAIPANGFYDTLDRLGPELSDHKKLRMVGKFLKVFKW